VIRRANPALRELGDVLRILARQNKQLEALAVDSDAIMQPLARERRHVSGAIGNIAAVAGATASRRAALAVSLRRLPRFLTELRATMESLGGVAQATTPGAADLGAAAPDINRFVEGSGPFASAGTPALESLGEAGKTGIPALQASLPVVKDMRALAAAVRPVGKTLAGLLTSLDRNDGIEQAMDFIFYSVAAVNGFDELGHYLRAGLIVNQCTSYATAPVPGCSANFVRQASSSSAGAAATRVAQQQPRPATGARAPDPAAGGQAPDPAEPLLDYLFGSDG
jgi:ABC-type transporter Mla subunit MlaD